MSDHGNRGSNDKRRNNDSNGYAISNTIHFFQQVTVTLVFYFKMQCAFLGLLHQCAEYQWAMCSGTRSVDRCDK